MSSTWFPDLSNQVIILVSPFVSLEVKSGLFSTKRKMVTHGWVPYLYDTLWSQSSERGHRWLEGKWILIYALSRWELVGSVVFLHQCYCDKGQ